LADVFQKKEKKNTLDLPKARKEDDVEKKKKKTEINKEIKKKEKKNSKQHPFNPSHSIPLKYLVSIHPFILFSIHTHTLTVPYHNILLLPPLLSPPPSSPSPSHVSAVTTGGGGTGGTILLFL
jgi:hypothetical protein